MPCSDLFIYFTLTIGVNLGDKIGPHKIIILSLFFQYLAYALMAFIPNYYVVIVSMCLFGVGAGIGNLTYIKNCWKFFPTRQGLINGIILGGTGISSCLLTPLADYMVINPERKPTDAEGIYPEDVANRVKLYLYILCGIFLVLGILSVFITFKYKEETLADFEEPIKGETEEAETKEEKSKETPAIKIEDKKSDHLKQAFLSLTNLKFVSFCFCGFCKK